MTRYEEARRIADMPRNADRAAFLAEVARTRSAEEAQQLQERALRLMQLRMRKRRLRFRTTAF